MKTFWVEHAGTPGAELPMRITEEIATFRRKTAGMEPR